jgi:hypothetical protein
VFSQVYDYALGRYGSSQLPEGMTVSFDIFHKIGG